MYDTDGTRKEPDWLDDRRHRVGLPADVISWSGCMNRQLSRVERGGRVSAMSDAFIKSLNEDPDQSYGDLLDSIRNKIIDMGFDHQTPQLSSLHPLDVDISFTC